MVVLRRHKIASEFINWCGEGDLNSRTTKDWILSPAPLTTRQSPPKVKKRSGQ